MSAQGRALRIEADPLLELLAEDTDLLQGFFSALKACDSRGRLPPALQKKGTDSQERGE